MCIEKGFSLRSSYTSYQARELTRACNNVKMKGEGVTEELLIKIQAQMLIQDVKNPELLRKVMKELLPEASKPHNK